MSGKGREGKGNEGEEDRRGPPGGGWTLARPHSKSEGEKGRREWEWVGWEEGPRGNGDMRLPNALQSIVLVQLVGGGGPGVGGVGGGRLGRGRGRRCLPVEHGAEEDPPEGVPVHLLDVGEEPANVLVQTLQRQLDHSQLRGGSVLCTMFS